MQLKLLLVYLAACAVIGFAEEAVENGAKDTATVMPTLPEDVIAGSADNSTDSTSLSVVKSTADVAR